MEVKELLHQLYKLGIKLSTDKDKLKIKSLNNIPSEQLDKIKNYKQEIIRYLNNENYKDKFSSIRNVEKKEYYNLSSAQRRLYFLQQLDITSTSYNIRLSIPLSFNINKLKIIEVIEKLILRHENFRTSFDVIDEIPVQKIHKKVYFDIEEYSIEQSENIDILNKINRHFDLSLAPLLRISYVNVKDSIDYLVIDMHHIISDGFSRAILEQEFQKLYSDEELSLIRLQYRDYSEWKNNEEQKNGLKAQETYWLRKLKGELPVLNLPTDYSRPAIQTHDGALISFTLSKEETGNIKLLAENNGLTLYMSILSVITMLLSKLSGQEDIIIGTPIAGRNHADLEKIVGMFVNTLVIRNDVSENISIKEFLNNIKKTALDAFKNQDYQFEDLVEKVSIDRDISRNPIFDVMFNLINQREFKGKLVEDGLNVHKEASVKFDLYLKAIEFSDKLLLNIEYNTRLFKAETIDRIIKYFKKIITDIEKYGTDVKIKEIEIIPDLVKQEKLSYFNDNLKCKLQNNTIQDRLQESYTKYKDRVALEIGIEHITYSKLKSRSLVVSNWINDKNIKKESLIGIFIDDRTKVIFSILGILNSSCVFVPIDTKLPENRIKLMVDTIGIDYFVTCEEEFSKLNQIITGQKRDNVLIINDAISDKKSDVIIDRSHSSDKIYTYFTSGSSGIPKPILGKNESLLQFIDWEINKFNIDQSFRISQLTNVGNDAFLRDMFTPLFSGGTICILQEDYIVLDGFKLTQWINNRNLTLVHCVPSLFKLFGNEYLLNSYYKGLKYVLMVGEQIRSSDLEKWYSSFGNKIQLVNLYGATETNLVKTFYVIKPEDVKRERLPIGQAVSGSRILILDKNKNVCDIGISGELYIRTAYGSYGYFNDDKLTKEKFINNPFKYDDDILLYRSGDIAVENSNNEIEIIGRIDSQVKIRGFRIELAEIENILLKLKDVKECAVIAREENNDKYLCAYIINKEDFNQEEIHNYLSTQLPEYMIPSYFVKLDKLPLTSSGKVNRKALPSPEVKAGDDYIAPSNETEEKLAAIWSGVLNIEKEEISTTASFFAIGGHSLKASVLTGRIHKEIGVELPLRDVFLHSSIKAQASQIKKSAKKDFVSIAKAKHQDYYSLSSAQKRLYLLQEMEQESTAYNMPYIIQLGKEADKEKIAEVFRQLIKRHENFRTSFEIRGEAPVQCIHEQVEFTIEEFRIEKEEEQGQRNQFIQAFDLSKAPLLRVAIVEINGEGSLLMIDMHHIISDATSHAIVKREFQKLYSGEDLLPLNLQYKDYSEWQNSNEQKIRVKEQEDYWIKKFDAEIPVLNLPIDYVRPVIQSHKGAKVWFTLSKEETQQIKFLAQENGITLYMSLLSVFSILISKLSGQEDIIVGTPIAGRNHSDLENIVGMFVNTLAIRNEVKGSITLKEFLKKLKQNTLGAFENQDYQFEDLVEKVSVERDTSRNPIIDVMFNLLNHTEYSRDLSDFSNEQYVHTSGISKFDLTLTIIDYGDQLLLSFEYCTKLFKAETIERYIGYFKQIVNQLTINSEKELSAIEIISKEEKQQLLNEFNETKLDFPREKTIYKLFEEQVKRTPDNIALVCGLTSITYSELNRQSNQLAQYLILKGVLEHDFVGIFSEATLKVYISILGVLKTGKAYLPIDISLPDSRIQYMLNDCGIKILIAGNHKKEYFDIENNPIVPIDISEIDTGDLCNLNLKTSSSNLAYIIYTSGSTGKPKGVLIENRSLVNLCFGHNNFYGIKQDDRISKFAGFGFDASVWEIFPGFIAGSSLYIIEENLKLDSEELNKYFEKKNITVSFLPTQFSEKFMDYDNKSLKILLTGGDKLNYFKQRDYKLYNNYGPTENTVVTTRFEVQSLENNIPIGKSIENNNVFILDRYNKIQVIGVSGELCISGEGIAQGYLNNPELTLEKFIEHPFKEGERLYCTGDLARWLPDGNIEFLGRIDQQVKIRGFRIELGEIENVLLKYESIKEGVVIDIEENGEKYLCAYLVIKEAYNEEEIRSYLSASLPDYMIPSYFVELEKIPLNSNGKVSRKALPAPEIKAGDSYVAPSNETEEKLVEIWSAVLNIEKEEISTTASFFAIGGHSLKASVLTGRIHKETGVEFPLRDVFLHSSIKAQASQIEISTKKDFESILKATEKDYYPLSSAQKRLYLLQEIELESTAYNMPYIIPLGSESDKEKIAEVFRQLISRHESFRTSFEIEGEEPVQRIHEQVDFKLEEFTIEKQDKQNIRQQFIKTFDLSQAPLLRVSKVDVKGESSLLMIDMHHIISDGVSHAILEQDFQRLYSGENLAPLSLQYKDYSEWQNSEQQQIKVKEQEEYWINKFAEEIPVLNLPIDKVRPAIQSHEGARVSFALSKEETQHIKSLAKENDLTLYMSVLTVLNILLSKLSGQEEIIVGTPIAGRTHRDLENIVGMFVNTLAIRNELNGNTTLKEFVEKLKQSTLEAFENQNYQFEELVENISIERDISRNPIFDVMFNLLNQTEHSADLTSFNNQNNIHTSSISKFDLTLTAVDYGDQLMLSFEYCTKLFKAETIDRFIVFFKQIVSQLAKNPETKISEIDILSEKEKNQLLYEFNNTETEFPKDKTIHQLFEEQVEKFPDRVLVSKDDTSISYFEINIRSNQLARQLKDTGVSVGNVVGLLTTRSEELLIGILGILKCGAAYLPLNSSWPKERVKFMLSDSCCSILIHGEAFKPDSDLECQFLDINNVEPNKSKGKNLELEMSSSNILYIIYTSGTTGIPKGVLTTHSNVSRVVLNTNYLSINKCDRILQLSSYTFDGSVFDIYGALLNGSRLVMLNNEDLLNIDQLLDLISKQQISIFFITTALFNTFVDYGMSKLKDVRKILFGGERISVQHTQKALEELGEGRLVHVYGPTETTVFASFHNINNIDEARETIPIGKPISNTTIYLLDKAQKLVPNGVPGEIYIGSRGNALGYLNNVELTIEKFIDHPYKKGEKLYQTGDLAYRLPNGSIEFLDRIDHQVKIRGFRIELGEIENALHRHENIKDSVVIDREENGEKYLCAYIVIEEKFNQEDVRTYLSDSLPDYMIPSYFVELKKIPLNSNGKVNRKALPSPEIKAGDDYVAPSSKTEEKLVDIWSEVLNVEKEKISIKANFFNIGGHSLKAMVIANRIQKEFSVKIPLTQFFKSPYIKSLALFITINIKQAQDQVEYTEMEF